MTTTRTFAETASIDTVCDPGGAIVHRMGRRPTAPPQPLPEASDFERRRAEKARRNHFRRNDVATPACAVDGDPMPVHSGYRAAEMGYTPCTATECFPADAA